MVENCEFRAATSATTVTPGTYLEKTVLTLTDVSGVQRHLNTIAPQTTVTKALSSTKSSTFGYFNQGYNVTCPLERDQK